MTLTSKTTKTTTAATVSRVRYHASGSVRGSCGHAHRSIETAERCRRRDSAACSSLGGGAYSDRVVLRTDGEDLDDAELDLLLAYSGGAPL